MCFRNALIRSPQHADASYNLATLLIDRAGCLPIFAHDISTAMNILKDIISRDTSRRGETTGLAHRTIAAALVKNYTSFVLSSDLSAYESLIQDAKAHMRMACGILANHAQDLDTLLFEFCELLHPMWLSYIDICKRTYNDSSEQLESDKYSHSVFLEKVGYMLSVVCEELSASLQTDCSSGIDLDVYLLWGEYLNDFVEHTIGRWMEFTPLDNDYVRSNIIKWEEWFNVVANTLLVLSDDNAEGLVQGGDVQHSLLTLFVYFKEITSPQYVSMILDLCKRLFDCRYASVENVPCLQTRSALADEWIAMADIVAHISHEPVLQEAISGFLRGQLAKFCVGYSDADGVPCSEVAGIESLVVNVLNEGKRIYVNAIQQYEEEVVTQEGKVGGGKLKPVDSEDMDEDDDNDVLSVAYYNAACVCWKLRHEDMCEVYMNRYLAMEREILGKSDGDNGVDDMIITWNQKLDAISVDNDLEGIKEREWFLVHYL